MALSATAPRGRRAAAAAALERSGLGALLRVAPTWRGLLALTYHRIGTPGDAPLDRAMWDATLEDFDAQVAFLARNFDVVGPADVGPKPPGRHVLITFDDGYRDNYTHALPILRAHAATATFFLTTGFLDRPRLAWWDEVAWMVRTSGGDGAEIPALLNRVKALPGTQREDFIDRLGARTGAGRAPAAVSAEQWMTWRMARELLAAGMTVGGHTVSHPILARLDEDAQHAEVVACRARLEAELGIPMRWFSYPNGDRGSFDARTRAIVAEAGVELAFAFHAGFVRRGDAWDPYALPRIAVGPRTAGPAFAATVTLPQVFGSRR
jgi:peptidoglycan/xylan/chitin deacetylase (PgdA/CDA1 family)